MKIKKNLWKIIIFFLLFIQPLKADSNIEDILNTYFYNMKIKKLVENSNFFSAVLTRNGNVYNVIGNNFPLDAQIEGNLHYIYIANKKIKVDMQLDAHIKDNIIKGNLIFSNYIASLNINLYKNIYTFDVKDVDIKYLLKKLDLGIKNLVGKTNIHLIYANNKYDINLNIKGFYQKVPFISIIKLIIHNNLIKVDGNIKSNILEGNFNISKEKDFLYECNFKKISLQLFDLIYPFRGIVNLKIKNDTNNIIKFTSENFKGFKEQNLLNITLLNMPISKFFSYIGLKNPFSKGIVNGNFNISTKKGAFNLLIKNSKLNRFISDKLGLKNIFKNVIFVKGYFNKKEVIFNLLYSDKSLYINITNGKLLIRNKKIVPDFILNIQKNNISLRYRINLKGIFLIKKRINENPNNGVVVY